MQEIPRQKALKWNIANCVIHNYTTHIIRTSFFDSLVHPAKAVSSSVKFAKTMGPTVGSKNLLVAYQF